MKSEGNKRVQCISGSKAGGMSSICCTYVHSSGLPQLRRWSSMKYQTSRLEFNFIRRFAEMKAKLDSIKHIYLPKRPDFTWSWSPCLICQVTVWFKKLWDDFSLEHFAHVILGNESNTHPSTPIIEVNIHSKQKIGFGRRNTRLWSRELNIKH